MLTLGGIRPTGSHLTLRYARSMSTEGWSDLRITVLQFKIICQIPPTSANVS